MTIGAIADEPAAPASPAVSEPKFAPVDEAERNPVFGQLVGGDEDVVGLIAYSVYKQNKLDWLHAFAKARGRDPDEAEIFAYIVGESTSRRLATYRLLAQATLEGKGPDVHVGDSRGPLWTPTRGRAGASWVQIAGAAALAAVVVFALMLIAAHFGALASH